MSDRSVSPPSPTIQSCISPPYRLSLLSGLDRTHFLLQGAWITNNLDDSTLIEDINGGYKDPKTFFYPGRYSEMVP
ncbi:hypothetical protein DL95DRAFT_389432, partial [Leptodontidium sp. 2 PMI_412]